MRVLFNQVATMIALVSLTACNSSTPSTTPTSGPPSGAGGHAGHDHGHSHAVAGPNGGHLIELGHEEYHLEWTHDDQTGLVTVYVLDSAAKDLVPISAEAISITAKVEETTEYQLPAVNPAGDPPTSAQFAIKDPALAVNLQLVGHGVEAFATLTIDGKEFKGVFEHLEHGHGHGHAH